MILKYLCTTTMNVRMHFNSRMTDWWLLMKDRAGVRIWGKSVRGSKFGEWARETPKPKALYYKIKIEKKKIYLITWKTEKEREKDKERGWSILHKLAAGGTGTGSSRSQAVHWSLLLVWQPPTCSTHHLSPLRCISNKDSVSVPKSGLTCCRMPGPQYFR